MVNTNYEVDISTIHSPSILLVSKRFKDDTSNNNNNKILCCAKTMIEQSRQNVSSTMQHTNIPNFLCKVSRTSIWQPFLYLLFPCFCSAVTWFVHFQTTNKNNNLLQHLLKYCSKTCWDREHHEKLYLRLWTVFLQQLLWYESNHPREPQQVLYFVSCWDCCPWIW